MQQHNLALSKITPSPSGPNRWPMPPWRNSCPGNKPPRDLISRWRSRLLRVLCWLLVATADQLLRLVPRLIQRRNPGSWQTRLLLRWSASLHNLAIRLRRHGH